MTYTWESQIFCKIFVRWETVWQLLILLSKLGKWWTTVKYEKTSSSNTLRMLLKGNDSMCYLIAKGLVFILSFFVGYILSFGLVRLRTIRLRARAGAHNKCSSQSRAEDVTITNVIIKTPDRKWDWGMNDVVPGSDGQGILVIFEKSSQLKFVSGRG